MHLIFEFLDTMKFSLWSFFTTNPISLTKERTETIVFWLLIGIFFMRLRIFQIHCIMEFLYQINNFWININITIKILDFRHFFGDNCHHSNRGRTRNFDFEERMRMRYGCFTFLTEIKIFTNAALVSNTINWTGITSITADTIMQNNLWLMRQA